MPQGDNNLALNSDELLEDGFMPGSPEEIAEQIIARNRQCGINHLVPQFHWVGIPQDLVLKSMTRFAEEVRRCSNKDYELKRGVILRASWMPGTEIEPFDGWRWRPFQNHDGGNDSCRR